MLDEELHQSKFPLIWDNTMRATGHQCKRKLYWFLRGYDYKGTSRVCACTDALWLALCCPRCVGTWTDGVLHQALGGLLLVLRNKIILSRLRRDPYIKVVKDSLNYL